MSTHPILLVGGSGTVGRWTARYLRETHPQLQLLFGGRDLEKATAAARTVGHADAVVIDLEADDLGLGDRDIGAVVVFFTEDRLATLRFAQSRNVPHLSISRGLFEICPEIGYYTHRPEASAIVLGTEWLVGATTLPVLKAAQSFSKIDRITINALLDEEDTTGPAGFADFDRQNAAMPSALARRNGAVVWKTKDDLKTSFRAIDGTQTESSAFSVNDMIVLTTVLDVPNIDFNLAIATSSTRRRGEPFSTEIISEISGQDQNGNSRSIRQAVMHPEGQMPLTALGVSLLLERLAGLDGMPPTPPGLYFPYQLLDPDRYFARFHQIGGKILELDMTDSGH